MKQKKIIMFIVFTILFSCLTGCGGTKDNANKTATNLSDEAVMTENTMPISEEGVTLSIWTRNSSQGYVKSYNDFESFKELAKITGVTLDFIHPSGADEEQLNIILASGDYPDIIIYGWGGNPKTQTLLESGIGIHLNDYIDKFAPNFKKAIEENDLYKEQMQLLGEDIAYFPTLYDNKKFMAYDGYFMRNDWLDEVGHDIPETIEDWEIVLTAFRDNDLNGNGENDEVPFSTLSSGNMVKSAFISAYGMGQFGYFIDPKIKEITHTVLKPDFKEFLTVMNRWYKEGLLNKTYLTTTAKELDSMMLNNQLGAVFIDNNNSLPKYMIGNPDMDFVAVPFPKDKSGNVYHPRYSSISMVSKRGPMLTSACKNVKEAVRFFDYLYTKEASDLLYWGVEGESYTIQDDGIYKYTDLILNNPEGKAPYEAICKYMTNTGFTSIHQYESMVGLESNLPDRIKKVKEQSVNYSLAADKSLLIYSLPQTIKEYEEIANLSTDLDTYMSEMFEKFILGTESLDNYNTFVEQVKKLGLSKIVEIKTEAYKRAQQ